MHEIWVSCEWMLIMRRRYKSCTSGRSRLPSSRYHWSLHPGLGCPGQCWGDRQYSQAADPAQGSTPVPTHLQWPCRCSMELQDSLPNAAVRGSVQESAASYAASWLSSTTCLLPRATSAPVSSGVTSMQAWPCPSDSDDESERWGKNERDDGSPSYLPLGQSLGLWWRNAVTNRDSYLFPHTDDTLGSTGGLLG